MIDDVVCQQGFLREPSRLIFGLITQSVLITQIMKNTENAVAFENVSKSRVLLQGSRS